ncbi:O-acyltransferase [Macleaya cordata]|uniref:O-acyltransferase n=1 Tax=Macleaya cordata TaxID=56857 RepID=A0A200PNM3_MACCD|nr:O-acyltransferase [Macleaya cordata]
MASNQPKEAQALLVEVEEEEVGVEKMHDHDDNLLLYQPVSPSSQCIHTSILSLCIIAIAESEIPINLSKILATLNDDLLRVNSRFSSIVVTDHKGLQWWKKVEVDVKDHVVVPSFPSGLSQETYTQHFKNYLSNIAQDQLPEKQPLWEMHVFMYPTSENTAGTLVFKMHHALGDGYSIMGALFSCLKRADDPSLPLTFPSSSGSSKSESLSSSGDQLMMKVGLKKMVRFVSGFWNSAAGFAWSVLQSTLLEDDQTVIRSGTPGVEFMPIDVTSVAFSLDHIRQVKSKVGGTVNDVVVGIVFYGTHLYSQAVAVDKTTTPSRTSNSRRTALVLLNTRMINGYRSLEDMIEKDLWGNHFSFIHLSIPSYSTSTDQEKVDPLSFILKAKKTIKRNRNSMSIYLNSALLRLVGSIKGPEAISQYVHSTMRNTSMAISNLAGPVEKMVIAEHPISNIYFMVSGCPQSLLCTILSYMGKLTLVMTTERGFIDSQLLASCMKEAFKKIFEEACGKDIVDGTNSSY